MTSKPTLIAAYYLAASASGSLLALTYAWHRGIR